MKDAVNPRRRDWIKRSAGIPGCAGVISAQPNNPLPSWNAGTAKQSIIDFVRTTTDKSSSDCVPPEHRIAVFDQDGTTWVEHPILSA